MNCFLLFLNKDLSPKIKPLYIHVHGYREKKWWYKLPFGFSDLKPLRVSVLVTFVLY